MPGTPARSTGIRNALSVLGLNKTAAPTSKSFMDLMEQAGGAVNEINDALTGTGFRKALTGLGAAYGGSLGSLNGFLAADSGRGGRGLMSGGLVGAATVPAGLYMLHSALKGKPLGVQLSMPSRIALGLASVPTMVLGPSTASVVASRLAMPEKT